MLDTVNANLAPPEVYAFEGEGIETWRLDQAGLKTVLHALFLDFPEQLRNGELRRHFLQRYGEDACAAAKAVIGNLNGDA